MAAVLDAVRPLASLLAQADDPDGLADALRLDAADVGPGGDATKLTARLTAAVVDAGLVPAVLKFSGVVDETGCVSDVAAVRVGQAQVLAAEEKAAGWQLVMTVPSFLRGPLADLVAAYGDAARPRETTQALGEVAGAARSRLVIAAPFLHTGFVASLVPDVERVLLAGGEVLVVTRALSLRSPERSSANADAVELLRAAGARAFRDVTVRSWEESGLGIHFKVLIADEDVAYLGSANFTPGGAGGHAELGVLLHGTGVAALARWVDVVAAELAARRLPSG